jgi:hypothetical protein
VLPDPLGDFAEGFWFREVSAIIHVDQFHLLGSSNATGLRLQAAATIRQDRWLNLPENS